jgi:hypothetical protein
MWLYFHSDRLQAPVWVSLRKKGWYKRIQSVHYEVLILSVSPAVGDLIFSVFAATWPQRIYMSVHRSACNNSRTVEQIFVKFCTEGFLMAFVDSYRVWLKSDSHNEHFTWRRISDTAQILSVT